MGMEKDKSNTRKRNIDSVDSRTSPFPDNTSHSRNRDTIELAHSKIKTAVLNDFYHLLYDHKPHIINITQSSTSNSSEEEPVCKFCYQSNAVGDLISPCNCKGSIKYVHKECLKQWQYKKSLKYSTTCEQCFMNYKYTESKSKLMIHLITMLMFGSGVLLFNFSLNMTMESVHFVLDELMYENMDVYNRYYNYTCDDSDTYENPDQLYGGRSLPLYKPYDSYRTRLDFDTHLLMLKWLKSKLTGITYIQSSLISVAIYLMLFNTYRTNYIYSTLKYLLLGICYWRSCSMSYMVDYTTILVLIYYNRKIYGGLYGYVERMQYLITNRFR